MEKRGLIGLLTKSGELPPETVEFGVLGPPECPLHTGANRNTILLTTAGEMALCVDDDTVGRPSVAPGATGTAAVRFAGGDPSSFWFFPDRSTALAAGRAIDLDILGSHEALLGRRYAERPPGGGRGVPAVGTGNGRILITVNGSAGDSGMDSGRNLAMHPDPGTRERLLASREAYESALTSREMIRQSLAPTVTPIRPFMSMAMGMDNRELTPPFFPACRNSDGIFGALTARVWPDACLGHLPWTVIHDPPGSRLNVSGISATLRVCDWVLAWASTGTFHNGGGAAAERMGSLGRHLIEAGSLPPADFREQTRALLLRMASRRAARAESLIHERRGEPAFWVEDLRREVEAVREAMVEPDGVAPVDLPVEWNGDQRIEATRSLIRRYGELLSWWPAIIERAKDLRTSH
jgi:hypothetical protein